MFYVFEVLKILFYAPIFWIRMFCVFILVMVDESHPTAAKDIVQ